MIIFKSFIFNDISFKFAYNDNDRSGIGCINEIVNSNEYLLNIFTGLKNKIFFDIGANIGIATIIMAKLNPESIIYSFEPNDYIFPILLTNIYINELKNVKAFNIGLSNSNSISKLLIKKDMSGAGTTIPNIDMFIDSYKDVITSIIHIKSFEEFIKENDIKDIELLKIDAEGSEYEILYNNSLLLNKKIHNIVGEFHYFIRSLPQHTPIDLFIYCNKYITNYLKIGFLNLYM